jgi:hypothetical protein
VARSAALVSKKIIVAQGVDTIASRVVLVTPLRSALGLSGAHDGLAVADLRHPDAVETLLAGFVRGGDVPIVTCAQADLEEVRLLLSYTGVRFPGFRAVLEPLPGSPLSIGVISSLVDDLEDPQGNTLAWQLSAIDHLRAHSWSAVWLPSVAGLSTPSPSMFQHVRSWFPGSGYLAVHSNGGAVLRANKAPITGLGQRPDTALLHSTLAEPTWVVDAVKEALGPQSVSDVATVREQIDSFGSARAVEFVAIPMNFHSAGVPDPARVTECAACGTVHARPACPLCGMVGNPASLVSTGGHS